MHAQRVKAALVFVPLILILIYFGGWAFNGFITLILLLAALEYAQLFSRLGYRPFLPVLFVGITSFVLQRWVFGGQYLGVLITFILFLTIITALVQYERGEKEAALGLTINLAGIFYLGWLGAFFISLRALPHGLGWMLTALPVTWLVDCGAYYIGRWLGKRKMTPRLSPKKTWAGLVGGLIAGIISGLLLILLWRSIGLLPIGTPLWQGVILGLVMGTLTPLGDLLISLFKRSAGVKDTGNLIPGHGGVLDRIDTWIWGAMLGYYLVLIF